eukprot:Ihof_evm1s313 gene=Ihof_evmTU1s313
MNLHKRKDISNMDIEQADNQAVVDTDTPKLQPTSNADFYATQLPQHWRCNKSFSHSFQVFAMCKIPDGTAVQVRAYNDDTQNAELKNATAIMENGVATFDDLRFVGRSGRGKAFTIELVIFTEPKQKTYLKDTMKVTVDGPREPRKGRSNAEKRNSAHMSAECRSPTHNGVSKYDYPCNSPLATHSSISSMTGMPNDDFQGVASSNKLRGLRGAVFGGHPAVRRNSSIPYSTVEPSIRQGNLARSTDELYQGTPHLQRTNSLCDKLAEFRRLSGKHFSAMIPGPVGHILSPKTRSNSVPQLTYLPNLVQQMKMETNEPTNLYDNLFDTASRPFSPMKSGASAGAKRRESIKQSSPLSSGGLIIPTPLTIDRISPQLLASPVHHDFHFTSLVPQTGREGTLCTAVLKLDPRVVESLGGWKKLHFCVTVAGKTPSFEKVDVCQDGTMYCKLRMPAPGNNPVCEVGAMLRDPQMRVFLAQGLHIFTFSYAYIDESEKLFLNGLHSLLANLHKCSQKQLLETKSNQNTLEEMQQLEVKVYPLCAHLLGPLTLLPTLPYVDDSVAMTVLHIAAEFGWLRFVMHLIEAGAEINQHDALGNTPLDWAVMCQQQEVVAYLQTKGGILHNLMHQIPNLGLQGIPTQPLSLIDRNISISDVLSTLSIGNKAGPVNPSNPSPNADPMSNSMKGNINNDNTNSDTLSDYSHSLLNSGAPPSDADVDYLVSTLKDTASYTLPTQ